MSNAIMAVIYVADVNSTSFGGNVGVGQLQKEVGQLDKLTIGTYTQGQSLDI